MRYIIILIQIFIFSLFIFSVNANEIDDFSKQAGFIVEDLKGNFSLSNVELKFADVRDGSAEAKRYPFRGYVIVLDYSELENASDFELRGMMAHELGHLETYSRMSWLGLAGYALHYEFSSKFRKEVERETDMIVIQHGFGEELLAFREYRLRTGSEKDKKILGDYYLSLEEIKKLTENA